MIGHSGSNEKFDEKSIWDELKGIPYPGFSRDIVDFGIVRDVQVSDEHVEISLEIISKDKTISDKIVAAIRTQLQSKLGITTIKFNNKVQVPDTQRPQSSLPKKSPETLIAGVKHKIAVASGKGGVGKSTVCVNIASTLMKLGFKVGVLDCDIYGPSIPLMLGVPDGKPRGDGEKMYPISNYNLHIMSIGFFLPKDTALVWRGPMVMKAIEQMLKDVIWSELDFLIIDMPPGTGDAQLSISQLIQLTGSIIVTTPQEVSLIDAVKGVQMFKKVNVPILGIVENMSYFSCPHCHEQTDIFDRGGGKRESERLGVPFLR